MYSQGLELFSLLRTNELIERLFFIVHDQDTVVQMLMSGDEHFI